MKKFLLGLVLILATTLAGATSKFVDNGCTNSGNGLTCDGTHGIADPECDDIANWICTTAGGPGPTCGSASYVLNGLDTARTYTILGFFQASGDLGAADEDLSIQIDGVEKCHLTPTVDVTDWQPFPGGADVTGACTFTPASASATLSFVKQQQAAGDTSYWIDDLEVVVSN